MVQAKTERCVGSEFRKGRTGERARLGKELAVAANARFFLCHRSKHQSKTLFTSIARSLFLLCYVSNGLCTEMYKISTKCSVFLSKLT